jgi:hypothetical protein
MATTQSSSHDLRERDVLVNPDQRGVDLHPFARLSRVTGDHIANPWITRRWPRERAAEQYFTLTQGMCQREASHNMCGSEHQRPILLGMQHRCAIGPNLVWLPVAIEAGGVDAVAGTDVDRSRRQG